MSSGPLPSRTSIIPCFRYRDLPGMIDWLCDAFGFERHLVAEGEGGNVEHAQLAFGNGMIMLGPGEAGARQDSQSPYILVRDADAHCAGATAKGAEIVMAPGDQPYGGRLYSCRDPEGQLWNFGTYDPWA